MRIFLTGASGCIGHYLTEALIEETEHELFLLLRNPAKLKIDYQNCDRVNILLGDLRDIERYKDLLATIDTAILAATAWGGEAESREINITKTIDLIELLSPEVCQQIIYFSTASILDRQDRLLPEAGKYGTDYIRTKYECFEQLSQLKIASKITAVFPTLVLGGDTSKPLSHVSGGLPEVVKWIGLIRWLKADGSFHFIHGRDIALVILYLIENPPHNSSSNEINKIVLGNAAITVDRAVTEICAYLNKKIYFRIPLSIWLANFFIKVFRIQMDDWSRFSLDYRHFTYQNPVNPANFNLKTYCPNLTEAMKITVISANRCG